MPVVAVLVLILVFILFFTRAQLVRKRKAEEFAATASTSKGEKRERAASLTVLVLILVFVLFFTRAQLTG